MNISFVCEQLIIYDSIYIYIFFLFSFIGRCQLGLIYSSTDLRVCSEIHSRPDHCRRARQELPSSAPCSDWTSWYKASSFGLCTKHYKEYFPPCLWTRYSGTVLPFILFSLPSIITCNSFFSLDNDVSHL